MIKIELKLIFKACNSLIVKVLLLTFIIFNFSYAQDTIQYDHQTQPLGPPPKVTKYTSQLELEKIYLIPANPEKGFYWDYYLATPKAIKPNIPLFIQPNNDGLVGVPIASHHYWASIIIEQARLDFGSKLGTFTLVPVFPRPATNDLNKNVYVHALSRASIENSNKKLKRPDQQLLAMIDDAQQKIRSENFSIPNKVMLWGFSAAGDFVTRMTFLHPSRIHSVVAGGLGGLPILPVTELNDTTLTYPVGIGDFQFISGSSIDLESLRAIPMLLFQGGNDENDSVMESQAIRDKSTYGSDSYSYEQALFINDYFGEHPVDRIQKVKEIYNDIEFKSFNYIIVPNIAHETKPFKAAILKFFKTYSMLDDK